MRTFANIRRRSICAAIFIFAFAQGRHEAQALTYYYLGPAWDTTQCAAHFSPSSVCQGGNLSGSVTFGGVSDTYSGTLHYADATSWIMSGSSVMTLSSGAALTGSGTFNISTGQMGGVVFQAARNSGGVNIGFQISALGASGYDDAYSIITPSGPYTAAS